MINQINLKQYKNIAFIGDIHGMFDTLIYDITKVRKFHNTAIIVCGDIGFGFVSYNKELENLKSINSKLKEFNDCLILYRGNHDDPFWFDIDNEKRKELEELYQYIKIIPDYSILNTVDGNILVIGGAISIDRMNRTKNISYWEDETVKDIPENFFNELKENNIIINIVCTHTAPLFCLPYNSDIEHQGEAVESWSFYDKTLKYENYNERLLLSNIYDILINNGFNIEYWIYGHFHNHFETMHNNTKCIGLDMCYNRKTFIYNDISTGKRLYKNLNDWFWISRKGKLGNIW